MKKNMSNFMKYKEKEECYDAVNTVAMKVNHHDADMMSHVIMSMFKVASAEANVPLPPPTPAPSEGYILIESRYTLFISGVLMYLQ